MIAHDEQINGQKIEAACHAIWAGAPFLATSMARYYFRKGSRGVSLSGAIGAGVAHITENMPPSSASPPWSPWRRSPHAPASTSQRILVVGDDVDVEIVMGRAAGAPTALVLSGTTGEKPREEIDRLDGDRRPDLVIENVGHLFSVLPALAVGIRG